MNATSSSSSIRNFLPRSLQVWKVTARQAIIRHTEAQGSLDTIVLPTAELPDIYLRLALLRLLDELDDTVATTETGAAAANLPRALVVSIFWLLHLPYAHAPRALQPFAASLTARNPSHGRQRVVRIIIDQILAADAPTLRKLGRQSALALLNRAAHSADAKLLAAPDRDDIRPLIAAARTRALNLSDYRRLGSYLASNQDHHDLVGAEDVACIASHNQPSLVVKLVAALRLADHAAPQLLALRTLKPSLRTLDLYTRLLISQEPMSLGSEEDAGSITLGRLSKRTALGDWLASAIANVEEPERRHEMDQERVGATVGRLCRFVKALMSHGILPNGHKTRGESHEEDSDVELACIVECRHFALRYGRFKEAGEIYASLLQVDM